MYRRDDLRASYNHDGSRNQQGNVYAYVRANPLSRIDRNGLEVTGIFYRGAGILTLADTETGASVTTRAFSGEDACKNNTSCEATINKGPLPSGKYLVGNGYDKGSGGDDWWYPLYGPDGSGGYAHNRIPVWDPRSSDYIIRGQFNLHTGLTSWGCLTVPSDVEGGDARYPMSADYSAIKDMLNGTKPFIYKGSTFKGTIDVR
jgi:hypothetical protein